MSNEAAVASPRSPLGSAAAPLGYLALGLTLLAFGLLSTGAIHGTSAGEAKSLAFLLGGVALFVTGLLEFRGGSAATGTAFAGLGALWAVWSQAGSWSANGAGLFLLLWALLALSLTLTHWGGGLFVRGVYALFTVALVLDAIGAFAGNGDLAKVGGWLTAVAGLLAWYTATSALSGGAWGRVSLPVR
ncbi:GPR1/FUN34/YaaH family transporter [Streptacidiphilus monticola]|uniref:GPR1/FUN34/YaaH family transporter n=1 Tax=Streptacidiphilus monticola TaxID=2161674 RepID=A0ABW1G505_9ACTN